jgi:hypothetical protein
VSDESFDADAGAFTDATGRANYYLGDLIGLAAADDVAYAAWTDTRGGNQDILFSRYPLPEPPAAPADRFEPNGDARTATEVGAVVRRHLPKLALPAGGGGGDDDWFRFTAAATGQVTVSAGSDAGAGVELELWDAGGTALLARGTGLIDTAGKAMGQRIEPVKRSQSVSAAAAAAAVAGTRWTCSRSAPTPTAASRAPMRGRSPRAGGTTTC